MQQCTVHGGPCPPKTTPRDSQTKTHHLPGKRHVSATWADFLWCQHYAWWRPATGGLLSTAHPWACITRMSDQVRCGAGLLEFSPAAMPKWATPPGETMISTYQNKAHAPTSWMVPSFNQQADRSIADSERLNEIYMRRWWTVAAGELRRGKLHIGHGGGGGCSTNNNKATQIQGEKDGNRWTSSPRNSWGLSVNGEWKMRTESWSTVDGSGVQGPMVTSKLPLDLVS